MIKRLLNSIVVFYSPKFPRLITYMLQSSEYGVGSYLKWFWTTEDFSKVQLRRELVKTEAAKSINRLLTFGMLAEIITGVVFIILGSTGHFTGGVPLGIAIVIFYPVLWSQLICLPLLAGRILVYKPKEKKMVSMSKDIFKAHQGIKIAVAGSYGKTSMKEMLATVLSEGKKVLPTPANKNVPISHAKYAFKLSGKEEILVIELGEGAPGDIKCFAETIKPDIAVITGLSPAHLDRYKTLEAAGKDIFSISKYVKPEDLFINGDSDLAKPYIPKEANLYDHSGALGWKVTNVKSSIDGVSFTLVKGSKKLNLKSNLIGKHQIGPLAFAAALGLKLGLTDKQVIAGIAKTKAFEHRMQAYRLNDAWIIDDTYNGNIEGIKVGTELLSSIPAKRKIYVTPGLVDQGKESPSIHKQLGELIAKAKPDMIVLMKNSVTEYIKSGLNKAGYSGELRIEKSPINFYSNLSSLVAKDDLVLMQNDWTDNYR